MKAAELIDLIDQAKVWEGLIGVSSTSVRFRSPFRQDPNPGCKLFKKDGKIKFADKSRGVVMDVIDAYKALNPQHTWHEICEGILAINGNSLSTKQQVAMGLIKEPSSVLTPDVIPWTEWGLSFWAERGVTEGDLNELETLTQEISGYTITGKDSQGNSYQRSYKKQGFVYWANDKPKFYFPLAEKKDKFKGSLTNNDAWLNLRGHISDRESPRTLVIAKSHKDLHVWKHFVHASLMAVTAEKVFPDREWLFTNVRTKFDRVVIVFDDDETGNLGANELKGILDSLSDIGEFRVEVWNFPDKETKDLDQYRVTHTRAETLEFLLARGFYNIFD